LAEIQERNKAVKDLEQSLLELHQIFLDMAVLVEAQVSSSRVVEVGEPGGKANRLSFLNLHPTALTRLLSPFSIIRARCWTTSRSRLSAVWGL
jgi:hypothetical protein